VRSSTRSAAAVVQCSWSTGLDIRLIDVVAFSAGATSALQLALQHPERVKHLALLVANLPAK